MGEIYNLGIGLSVVDTASAPIRAIDASLTSLGRKVGDFPAGDLSAGFEAATDSASKLSMVLTGNSVDDDLDAVSDRAEKLRDVIWSLRDQKRDLIEQMRDGVDVTQELRQEYADLSGSLAVLESRYQSTVGEQDAFLSDLSNSLVLDRAEAATLRLRDELGRFVGSASRTQEAADRAAASIANMSDEMCEEEDIGEMSDALEGAFDVPGAGTLADTFRSAGSAASAFFQVFADNSVSDQLEGVEWQAASVREELGRLRLEHAKLSAASAESGADLARLGEQMGKNRARTEKLTASLDAMPMQRVKILVGALAGGIARLTGNIEALPTGDLLKGIVDLEHQTHQLAVGLGEGSQSTDEMMDAQLRLVGATRFSVSQIAALNAELVKTGRNLTDFSDETQQAMINLQNTFGMAGDQIVDTAIDAEHFGVELGDVLGIGVAFQKSFGVPGVFEQLDDIVKNTTTVLTKFSGTVSGTGRDVVENTLKMAGVYARAFGKTMPDASAAAMRSLDFFLDESQTFEDVLLGLADDWGPFQNMMQEFGVGVLESNAMLKRGQKDVVGFAGELRQIAERYGEGTWAHQRFMRQIQKSDMPDELKRLVTVEGAYGAALEERARAQEFADTAGGMGIKEFNALGDAMLDTTSAMSEMWQNTKELAKATIGQIALQLDLKGVFTDARDAMASFAGRIHDFVRSEGFQEWTERVGPTLRVVGKSVLFLGTVFGGLATAVGGAMGVLLSAGAGWKLAKGVLGKVTELLPRLGGGISSVLGGIGGLGKGIARFIPGLAQVWAIGNGVYTAFTDMAEVMGDPLATPLERVEGLFRGLVKGIGSAIDSLLLGIPGMLLDVFFPDMESAFDEGFSGIFDSLKDINVRELLHSMWDGAQEWVTEGITSLLGMFSGSASAVDWGAVGESFGDTMGGLWLTVWSMLEWSFWNLNPIGSLTDLFYRMGTEGISAGFESWADTNFLGGIWTFVWEKTWDAAKWAFWNLSPIGIMIEMFQSAASGGWDGLVDFFVQKATGGSGSIGNAIRGALVSAFEFAMGALEGMGDRLLDAVGLKTSVAEIGIGFKTMWNWLKTGFMTAAGFIAPKIAFFYESVVGGMRFVAEAIGEGWNSVLTVGDFVATALGKGWAGLFAGIKIAGYKVLSGLTAAFNSVYGVVLEMQLIAADAAWQLTKAGSEAEAAADAEWRAIKAKKDALEDTAALDQAEIDRLQQQIAAANGLDGAWEEATASQTARSEQLATLLDDTLGQVEGLSDATGDFFSAQTAELEAEREALAADSSMAADERRRREVYISDAEAWQAAHLSDLDSALMQLAHAGTRIPGYDQDAVNASARALKEHFESALRSLGSAVAKGDIDAATATKRLADIQQRAVLNAYNAAIGAPVDAGEVAEEARGEGGGGITREMWAAMVSALEGRAPRGGEHRWRVDIRGGDRITTEIAREAVLAELTEGGT